jgi:hypothetical protein
MKFRLALLSCALAAVVFAADATGKWSFETQGRNGPTTQTLNLKQDGGSLTGTLAGGRGGEVQISDGKVDGNNVSFNVVREFRGNQMTINITTLSVMDCESFLLRRRSKRIRQSR